MEQPTLVQLQLSELRQELIQAEAMLGQIDTGDDRSRARVMPRFQQELRTLRDALTRLAETAGGDTDRKPYQQLRQNTNELRGELLAFAQGVLLRETKLDGGLCEVAEQLVDELTSNPDWHGRVVVPGEQEVIGDMVIRIRTSQRSIWRLPLAAHELGHFIGPRIEVPHRDGRYRGFDHPVAKLLDIEREDHGGDLAWSHLNETFADVFATYTMGAAFAASLILLELTPEHAYTMTHPADAKRVDIVLQILSRMDDAQRYGSPYLHTVTQLRKWWDSAITAVGGEPNRTGPDSGRHADDIYDLLVRELPNDAHAVTTGTYRIENLLANPTAPIEAHDGDRVVDVLTAAWRIRLRDGPGLSQPDRVGERALQLCRAILPPAVNGRPSGQH